MSHNLPTRQSLSWKQHTCCVCGCVYRYQMARHSQGTLLESGHEIAQRKLATEVDVHPCPTCGLIQPDMIGQGSSFWHGIITTVCFLAFLLLTILGSIPAALGPDKAAIGGVGIAGLALVVHLIFVVRNPNRNRERNRRLAETEVAEGTIEVIRPGSEKERLPAPRGSWICHGLALLALAGAIPVFLNQREILKSRDVPTNPNLGSVIVAPGDTVQISFDTTLHSVNGFWQGTPKAALVNASELGVAPTLTSFGHNDTWGDKLYAKNYEMRRPWVPYAKLDIPKNAVLEGKTLRVRLTMTVNYPVTDGKIFHDETKTMTKDLAIQVGSTGEVREYWTAWGLAIGVGSLGNLTGGLALCLLGVTLRGRAHPTVMTPVVKNAPRAAKAPGRAEQSAAHSQEPPPLPGAFVTKPTTPPQALGFLATSSLARSGPLPYFHAKLYSAWRPGRTVYRVYVTDSDFLFIDLGIGTLTPEDHIRNTPAMMGGGAIPALIGIAIGHAVAAAARQRLERLNKSLAAADEGLLREYLEQDNTGFILPFEEVQGVSINPKTFWGSLVCAHLVAFLELNRGRKGPMTLALLAPNEMVTVMGEMKRVFGEIECNLSWRAF